MVSKGFKNRYNVFDYANIVLMALVMIIMLYPMWYSVIGSLNEGKDFMRGGVYFWPRKFTIKNYQAIFFNNAIINAFGVTIARCFIGTFSSLLITSMASYALVSPILKGKKFYIPYIMFTMYFGGGLIPYFILIKDLGLYNNFLVYIIPGLFSVWNTIIIQSFFRDLPSSVFESARIDGAGEYRIFFQIAPLSKPVLAAIVLFSFVGSWNSYFDSMMYTSSPQLQTIQLFLMKLITDPASAKAMGRAAAQSMPSQARQITPQTLKLAAMTITALPIITIYPFLQRYFVKGVMVGSIKG